MVSVGVCNQQFQGTDYTFNGLWLPGCRKALLCKHMTRFLLVRFLLVCYNSAMQCIEYIYMTKKSTWFPEAKPKKGKKFTKYFPFFCSGYFRSIFKCASDFSKCFFINKDQPQKHHPAHLLPPFCFTHEKKVAWQKEDIPKHLPQTKGHRATHGWCFLFHQQTFLLVEIHHLPRGCGRRIPFFFGDTFWDDWLGVIFWKESGSTIWFNEKTPNGAPMNMNGMGRIPIIWNKKNNVYNSSVSRFRLTMTITV